MRAVSRMEDLTRAEIMLAPRGNVHEQDEPRSGYSVLYDPVKLLQG